MRGYARLSFAPDPCVVLLGYWAHVLRAGRFDAEARGHIAALEEFGADEWIATNHN